MNKLLAKQLHQVLPQTQCQMCGYKDCQAYANALAQDENNIGLCAPGGKQVLEELAQLTKQNTEDYIRSVEKNYRPPQRMHIRQEACIGCTKCIQACPIDAIIGTGKHRHDILADACNGCELCLPACPVDCIDTITLDVDPNEFRKKHQTQGHLRYTNRLNRIQKPNTEIDRSTEPGNEHDTVSARKAEIEKLIERMKNKK